MKQAQGKPTVVSASVTMFAYLQEKVGERKTKIEAYCDLWNKASVGFVSPFLRNNEQKLELSQCHITITDLAESWHWHRATVRSFLEHLEEFGQLTIERLPKSYIITMPKTTDEQTCPFGDPYYGIISGTKDVLTAWVADDTDDKGASNLIGKMFDETREEMLKDMGANMSTNTGTESEEGAEPTVYQEIARLRQNIFTLIVRYAFCKAVLSIEEDEAVPLYDFFEHDLDNDWPSVIEASKTLSELVLNGSSSSLDFESKQAKARFQTLVEPFKAVLAKSMTKSSGSKAEKPIV